MTTPVAAPRYAGLPQSVRRRLEVADPMRRQPLATDIVTQMSSRRLSALPLATRVSLAEDIAWHHGVPMGGDAGRAYDKVMSLSAADPAVLGHHDVAFGHIADDFMRHPAGEGNPRRWAEMSEKQKLKALNSLAHRIAHVMHAEPISLMARPLPVGLDGELPDCSRFANDKGHMIVVLNSARKGPLHCQTAAAVTVFRAQIEQTLRNRLAEFGSGVPADTPHADSWRLLRLTARHVSPATETAVGRAHMPLGRLIDTVAAAFDARLRLPALIGPVFDWVKPPRM